MKVGIITFQKTTNYGALLQATALQKKIQDLGADSEILDYTCEEIEKREMPGSIFQNGILHAPIDILSNYFSSSKLRKMERFKKEHCRLSNAKYNRDNIKEANGRYDVFLSGSDMIWELNVTGGDTSYYLDFVSELKKKYAYSTSFGYDEVPEEYRTITKELLSSYSCITVRENEGAKIIDNLLNKSVDVTVDPTLLLKGSEWRALEEQCNINKPFVLMYFNDEKDITLNYAIELAKKEGLLLVILRNSLRNIPGSVTIRDASVGQFLWLIDHAKYVVTASYHGVLFSLNFNTDFFYYNRAHFGRINTIINSVGLLKREIGYGFEDKPEIDWDGVNEAIARLREKSETILKSYVQ